MCLCAERTNIRASFVWDHERLTTLYMGVRGWTGSEWFWEGGRTPSTRIIDTVLAEADASRSKKPGWWSSALQSDPSHPTQRDELPGTRLYLLLRLDLILIFLPSFSLSFSLRPVSNFSLSGIKTLIALLSVRYLRRCWVQCRRFMWWLLFACAPAWRYMQNCHGFDTSAPAVEHCRDICVIAHTTQLHVHSLL